MFERFTEKARRVIFQSRFAVTQLGGGRIEPEHILIALLREEKQLFMPWLRTDESLAMLTGEAERLADRGGPAPETDEVALSPGTRRILANGIQEAELLHHGKVRPSHLLASLLRENGSQAAALLRRYGVDMEQTRLTILAASEGAGAEAHGETDEQDLHQMIEALPPSQYGRARVLLQALLEINRSTGGER